MKQVSENTASTKPPSFAASQRKAKKAKHSNYFGKIAQCRRVEDNTESVTSFYMLGYN